MIRQHQFNTSA